MSEHRDWPSPEEAYPRFMRRVRVHQAWYRATVLGVERYGRLAGSGAPCGSVLPDDAAARHLNFLDDEAVQSAGIP